ncbi:hypothetical protein AB0O22_09145 [Streptomyces sp. NPDC091204]|uniref:cytochrome P450 n=1 Tax=Streptomyces sp. NPDC091204 TaxID=3155299 RepID=UPI003439FDEF
MLGPRAIEAARLMLRLRTAEDQAVVYARLSELGPVHVMPWKTVVVTNYELCRHVLVDPSYAALDAAWRDQLTPGWRTNRCLVTFHTALVTMNPPAHAPLRRTLTAELSPRVVAALGPRVAAAVDRCLEGVAETMAGGGIVDLVPALAAKLPIEILCIWLGLPTQDASQLAQLTRRWSAAHDISPTPGQLADADLAHDTLCAYLLPHLEQRRRAPGDDTLSRWLLPAPHGGGLDIGQVLASTALAFLGAKDLTTLITSAVHVLIAAPSLASRLRQDAACAEAVAEDVIRLHPAIAIMSRVATREMVLGGVSVAAGSLVQLLVHPANREAAETSSTLSFGAGIHYCPAASLNRLTLRILLAQLAARFPTLVCSDGPVKTEGVVFPHLPQLRATYALAPPCPQQRAMEGRVADLPRR